jgi:hypothetical protein
MHDNAYTSAIHHDLALAAGIIGGQVREFPEVSVEMPEEESGTPVGERQPVARSLRESQQEIDRAVEEMRHGH